MALCEGPRFSMQTFYELTALLPGTLSDEETESTTAALRKLLEEHGAIVAKHGIWEKRKLAYPVNHIRQGTYVITEFDMEPAEVAAVERTLQLEKAVLRHIIVKAHKKTAKEMEQEARRRTEHLEKPVERQPARPAEPIKEISKEELEEKLEEILKDDMTL